MAFEKPVVVIDNGSYTIKAGFACDNHPVSIFRTVVGRPSYLNGSYGREFYDVFIGDDAVAQANLDLNHPVVKGRIVHWDNMERIWHHVFYRELKAAPEDRAVMLGVTPSTPMAEKIKCCEVFFETLNAPGLCVQPQSVLSIYGSGYTTGLCVDIGYDTTDINPVYEGGLISYAHMTTNLSGMHISKYIKDCLEKRNIDLGPRPLDIIEDIKNNYLFITQDKAITLGAHKLSYTLPSGEVIDISEESFMAAEMLFEPDAVAGVETHYMSLQNAAVTATMKCDPDLRTDLYDAVVPCGGMATIPGLNERLATEMEEIIHKPVNVIPSTEAYAVSWLGGATFAGMPEAQKLWVLKKQFEEYGAKIVRNKFLT